MTRTLRGAWARRRALAPLAALATTLVASLTACLSRAADAGDPALAAPLVLLGAVALAVPARAVAGDRREEIALGRLRGRGTMRLVGHLLAEPLLALALGGLVGLVLGVLLAPGAVPTAVLALAGVVAVGALSIAVVLAARLREPLAEQVAPLARPRASSTAAVFVGLLALAAAGYAVFAAHQRPAGPRWLVDVAPALVGLAVGQVLVWLVRALARAAVRRSDRATPAVFLAVRRLARRNGTLAPLALVVAAALVATVGATAARSAHAWLDQAGRLRAGAAVQVRLDHVSAARALSLTHRLDPRGRWLMAAAVLPRQGDAAASVLVDTPRFGRVAGPVLGGTAAGPALRLVRRLPTGPAPARGDTVELSGRVSGAAPQRIDVRVDYVTDGNFVATRTLTARPTPDGTVRARSHVPGCAHGCWPTSVSIGVRGPKTGTLTIGSLDFAGRDLRALFGPRLRRVPLAHRPHGLRPAAATSRLPAIATPAAAEVVQGPDGAARPAAVRGRVAALPLAGTTATLADLGTALAGALPSSPGTQVLALARADTPARILRALPGTAVTLPQLHRRIAAASGSARASTALLAGLCALLAAGIGLLAGVARQRRELAHEIAALRVVGYPRDQLRSSVRAELLACGAATLVAVALGSWLVSAVLLDRMPFLTVPGDAVAPDFTAPAWLLAAGGLLALAVVAVLVGRGRAVTEPASRPAVLREEGVA